MKPNAAEPTSLPAKCSVCNHTLNTPAVCDYCHTLSPAAEMVDYFRLLGVPRRFGLDEQELRRKYLALNRHAHPDFHTEDSPEVKDLALKISSALNNAYRTLSDPVERAEYLMELLGGKSTPRTSPCRTASWSR